MTYLPRDESRDYTCQGRSVKMTAALLMLNGMSMHTMQLDGKGDVTNPFVVDVAALEVEGTDTIVIADYNNKSLKAFFIRDKRFQHSSLRLYSAPWTVNKMDEGQVVVAFQDDHKIVIAKVTPDLDLLTTISTEKQYQCATGLKDSTIVAACWNPGSLDILDMKGEVKRSVPNTENLIKLPRFLCTTNGGNIVVSEHDGTSVYCLTPEGEIVFNYSPTGKRSLVHTHGITTTTSGYILVADQSLNKVVQLTGTGDFVRDLVKPEDSIDRPDGICFHKQRLYVSQYRVLKVFNVHKVK